MNLLSTILALTALLALGRGAMADDEEAEGFEPEISVSKSTTFATKPLNKDGSVDFAGALNLHYGKGATAKNNANVLFWQAMGPRPEGSPMDPKFYKLMGMKAPPEQALYLMHLHGFLQKLYGNNIPAAQRDLIYEQQGLAQTQPWSNADYPDIAAWLAANERPLKLLVAGSKRSHYYSPMVVPQDKKKSFGLVAVLLPGIQASRSTARMLTARAMRHVKAGNTDAAWDDLIACHRIGRMIGRGPTVIEGLVGYAIASIASEATASFLEHSQFTAKQLTRYRREFAALPPIPSMAEKVNLSERMTFLDSITLLAYGGPKRFKQLFDFGVGQGAAPKIPKVDFRAIEWDPVLRTANRRYDKIVAAMSLPNRTARLKATRAVNREIEQLAAAAKAAGNPKNAKEAGELIGNLLISMLTPAFARAQAAEDRFAQRHRNISVALALAAYRIDNGRYPKRISELAPKYFKVVPGDLYSGNALKYVQDKSGYLLYSIGANQKDDGGKTFGEGADVSDDLRIAISHARNQ